MGVFASDTFAGMADGATLSGRTASGGGTWAVSSGGAFCATDDADPRIRSNIQSTSLAKLAVTPASADYTVSADIIPDTVGADIDVFLGVAGRVSIDSGLYGYFAFAADHTTASSRRYRIAKFVNSSFTYLAATASAPSWTADTAYRIEIVLEGTSIRCIVDGVAQAAVTDAGVTAAYNPGVFANLSSANDTAGWNLDNFEASEVDFADAWAYDLFDGTSGTAITSRALTGPANATWSGTTASWVMTPGRRVRCSAAGHTFAVTDVTTAADLLVAADVTVITALNMQAGVCARHTFANVSGYYACFNANSDLFKLFKRVFNVETQLGSSVSNAFVVNTTYTVQLECTGTTIHGWWDAQTGVTVTDASIADGASAGIYSFGSASNDTSGMHIDNFRVNVTQAYTLAADGATVEITGNAAGLRAARKLAAAYATVEITGNAAALRAARKLVAEGAAVEITGLAAALRVARKLAAAGATVTITGIDATLTYEGTAAPTYTLTAEGANVTITGQAATLRRGYVLPAGTGEFAITGQAAALRAARKLVAAGATVTITGHSATLTYTLPQAGSIVLVLDARITKRLMLDAEITKQILLDAEITDRIMVESHV